ncbi:MAG: two-component regulator propeller domain-containing protein [Flammeovirgaceae bacterium]
MIFIRLTILLGIIILTLGTHPPTLGQKYHYKVYSVDNGLPQSEVLPNSLIQDERGSIWVGTNGGGVVRFDGDSKTIISKQDGLPSNAIRGLYLDNKKNLWITTVSGISKFDGYTFTNYLDTGKVLNNINNIAGRPQVLEDKFGNIWLRTAAILFLLQDSVFVDYGKSDPNFTGVAFPSAFIDKDGQLWLTTTTNGVWMFNGEKFIPAPILHNELSEGKNLPFALYDKDYNTWYLAVEPQTGKIQLLMNNDDYWKDFQLPTGFNPTLITDIMVDQDENIWITNFSTGVLKYDGEKFWEFNMKNGMPTDAASGVLEDYEGNIWVSTRGGGLVKIPSTGFTNFSTNDGLPHPIVFAMYEDSKGHIWIGATNNGFCKYDGEKIVNFPNLPVLTLGRIDDFLEEDTGNMLVATRLGGIFRFNGKTVQPVNQEFGLPAGMACLFLEKADEDRLLLGMGNGLHIWSKSSKKIIQTFNMANGLNSNFIQDVKIDAKGNYWILSIGGVSLYDGTVCKPLVTAANEPLGVCLQAAFDKAGNVWAVSFDRGVYRMNEKEIKYFDLTQGEGNETNLFYSIVADEQGSLWLGTQRGVEKIDLDEQFNITRRTRFQTSDGLSGIEMNGRAVLKDSKGNIWFGHLNGVSYYTPTEKVFNETPPVSALTGLDLFYEKVNWGDQQYATMHSGISKWYNLPQNLVLPHDQNHLTFKFSSMSYTLPEKVKRQWMMVPLDKEWLNPTTKKEATYSSLAPGEYEFRVRTQNNDGVWGAPINYAFEIKPPFWLTWWFWSILGILVIGSVVLAVRIRVKALKEKKAELERLVKVRTAELTNRNEEIIMQNAALEQQKEEILTQAEEIEIQNKALFNANKEVLEQHKSITSSITYAKRIQVAMLPRTDRIKNALPESFIIYEPRDIVSGDFYWFDEQVDGNGNKKIIFAAADCTGHGVPGAFMSMAGDAYLNIAVRNKHILEPNKILDELNDNIGKALKQGITENRDGMDISLCVIDKEKQLLEFAGARNPLLYIHNGELNQLNADKQSIGGSLKGKNGHNFTKSSLQYQPNTTFYMFSDGYVDQFGGPENRKYLIKNFRELLLDIHQFPMAKQQKILTDSLESWRGDYRQIDDILVIGFRL